MLYMAKSNFMADEINLFVKKGDVFSDEKPEMKKFLLQYPKIFLAKNDSEEAVVLTSGPKKIKTSKPKAVPLTDVDQGTSKGKEKNKKTDGKVIVGKDFDAEANPGVIPEYAPTDGEPIKMHSRDLPDAVVSEEKKDLF